MKEKPLYHLLIPGEFKVWCRPHDSVGDYNVTNLPSKANCANCLTALRRSKPGSGRGRGGFKVCWTSRHEPMEHTPELKE